MSDNTEVRYELEPVLRIDTVEGLKAFADPLRLRIMRALYVGQEGRALSGRELQELLGETKNRRIYYHLKQLEENGFVVRAFERKRGNLLEAFFRPVAANVQVDPALLAREPGQTSPKRQMAEAIVGALHSDLAVLDRVDPELTLISHRALTLDEARASAFRTELKALIARYERSDEGAGDDYRVTIALYPCLDTA